MALIEVRMCDEDRKEYGGPEWTTLDVDRLFDSPAALLERWEAETGYAIERAAAECALAFPPAKAVRTIVWLARKQHGANADAIDDDGQPEPFARLQDLKTMKVRIRDVAGDADPPDQSEQPTPEP